ncbi:hypothetical protein BLOT_008014 [Blomia tropicalis]|nr:hypothetical protein BLOT_008014 [Blomia tropicalis]
MKLDGRMADGMKLDGRMADGMKLDRRIADGMKLDGRMADVYQNDSKLEKKKRIIGISNYSRHELSGFYCIPKLYKAVLPSVSSTTCFQRSANGFESMRLKYSVGMTIPPPPPPWLEPAALCGGPCSSVWVGAGRCDFGG